MASAFKLGVTAMQAACNGIVDLLDVGGAGTLAIRSGAPPTNPGDANSGTLLATLTLSATAFGAADASGIATAAAITSDSSADASADAGHFRFFSGGGTCIFQGTAGNAADTPDLTFDNKSIVSGGTVACTAFTVQIPQT